MELDLLAIETLLACRAGNIPRRAARDIFGIFKCYSFFVSLSLSLSISLFLLLSFSLRVYVNDNSNHSVIIMLHPVKIRLRHYRLSVRFARTQDGVLSPTQVLQSSKGMWRHACEMLQYCAGA